MWRILDILSYFYRSKILPVIIQPAIKFMRNVPEVFFCQNFITLFIYKVDNGVDSEKIPMSII